MPGEWDTVWLWTGYIWSDCEWRLGIYVQTVTGDWAYKGQSVNGDWNKGQSVHGDWVYKFRLRLKNGYKCLGFGNLGI